MFCLIPFKCECEECGKEFNGVFWRLVPEDEISPLANVMSDVVTLSLYSLPLFTLSDVPETSPSA